MSLYELRQHVRTAVQKSRQIVPVKTKLHLVETDKRHDEGAEFLPEVLRQGKFFLVELIVAIQDPDLDGDLDDVLDDLLGIFLVACILLDHAGQVVQDVPHGVVDEEVGHTLGGHLAGNFLLKA